MIEDAKAGKIDTVIVKDFFTIWQRLYWSWRLSGASVPTPGNPLYFIKQ